MAIRPTPLDTRIEDAGCGNRHDGTDATVDGEGESIDGSQNCRVGRDVVDEELNAG